LISCCEIVEEWWRATEGERTVRRELLACDHTDLPLWRIWV
jgi:hypothetical protein